LGAPSSSLAAGDAGSNWMLFSLYLSDELMMAIFSIWFYKKSHLTKHLDWCHIYGKYS
jgi:hypothetical protein